MAEELTIWQSEVEHQRDLHRRAQAGDETALEELYRSMMPLIKSRVRRVLAHHRDALGSWYDLEDLTQDAYVVFHRFVMSCDPEVPLYRLVAGTFERSLRTHLRRHGPLHQEPPAGTEPPGGWEHVLDGRRRAGGPSGYERACAGELLALLPTESEREIVRLAAAGYTGREVAHKLGCSLASLRYRRRRIRTHLAIRGVTRAAYW